MLEERLLDTSIHERAAFVSGSAELDQYLRQFATQHIKKGVTSIRVLVDSDSPQEILGFYTLSAAQVELKELTSSDQKKLPRYPVPCFRMGRLAVHVDHQGKGYGAMLLGLAVERCLEARKHVAAYALLVDAKDEHAKSFYERHGFVACSDRPLTLYIGLGATTS